MEGELTTVHEDTGEGVDQLRIMYGNTSTTVAKSLSLTGGLANFEQITVSGTGLFNLTGNDSDNILTGNASKNILNGGNGNDTLSGLAGNDSLVGGEGNDLLDGGAGIDTMVGGQDDDFYLVDNAGDIISEGFGEGIDTIQSSITFSLVDTDKTGPDGGNVENLILGGISAINGTGNDLNNILTGNKAANKLDGGVGNDTLFGGLGNDILTGGSGNDLFVFDTALNASNNKDTIADMIHGEDLVSLDHDIFNKLSVGALDAANFMANTTGKAGDSDDYIVYNTTTGALFYDADGSGSGAAVQFTILGTKPNDITAGDFLVAA
jgi:Ca2+-binding RTX toxin-like protein